MSKTAVLAPVILLSWFILGVFVSIPEGVFWAAIIGLFVGVYLVVLENKELERRDIKKGRKGK